jgi:tol-pal system protein YbgF
MALRTFLPVGLLALGLAGCATAPEKDPAFIKATAVEGRVERVERQNQALLELQRQVDGMQEELRRLRGELEEANHGSKASSAESRNLYTDLERRLKALEERPVVTTPPPVAPAVGTPAGSATPVAAPAPAGDREAYQAALDRIKAKDFPGAQAALKGFIDNFPQSGLADNAKYWLGETYYSEGKFPEAVASFARLLKEHPDSRKAPDAWLMTGKAQYELKRFREAREAFARILRDYKDSEAVGEAKARLKRMDAERH